jgi:hypothetical protein
MNTLTRFLLTAGIVLLLAISSGCALTQVHSPPGTTTTVILIRHADREASDQLNELGRQRARILVEEVKDMGITAIYSPDLARNLDTARPLAETLGIEITLTPAVSLLAGSQIVDEIMAKHAGKTVLWVGNASGNLQYIYSRLGGRGVGPLEYGDLYILRIPDRGPTDVIKRRFGPPSQEKK